MATSKKDHVAVAATLRRMANDIENGYNAGEGDLHGRDEFTYRLRVIARDMAAYFAADNPRFDTRIFFKACGLEVL